MQPPGLVWDTSTLLTLAASGRAKDIVPALGCPNYVVQKVRVGEALYLRSLQSEEGLVEFDFQPFLDAGLFQEIELSAEEEATFVDLARQIDDGEAMTIAAAVHRGFWVTTDDRKALRLLQSLSPPIPALTTVHWLQQWADQASLSTEAIGEVLRAIRIRASYVPRPAHPLSTWWTAHYPTAP